MIKLPLTYAKHLNPLKYSITYTRQHFENLNIDREQIERNRKIQQQKELKQSIKAIKSNDKNPNNFIKNLKIDHQVFAHVEKMKAKNIVDNCAIITPEPKKTPVRFSAIRKYIITTLKKATFAMKVIRKKYIYDAINSLEQSHKKVAKLMVPTLYNLVRHGMEKGLDPLRLYVHGAIIGRTMSFKGVRYHAKGRGNRQIKTMCQIKIIIQERDQKQFWQQVGSGEAPAGFAAITRQRLLRIGANYQDLVNLGCVTTAKGRQQKRQIIKRRIALKFKQNEKQNKFVPKKTLEKEIREQQGQKIKNIFYGLQVPGHLPSISNRQKLFKKNMGIE